MRRGMKRRISMLLTITVTMALLAGCGSREAENADDAVSTDNTVSTEAAVETEEAASENVDSTESVNEQTTASGEMLPDVEVQFGEEGAVYLLHPYNNQTAAELVRNIGESGRNLPIYHFDDFEGYEYMQYYDIPSSYTIPSDPETVTAVKAGEVYYSDPNRVILIYQDAEISGEYTKVGYFDDSEEFRSAVDENPVLEGWGNKLILIRYADK